jgi:Fe-S cluster assembly protein SufD
MSASHLGPSPLPEKAPHSPHTLGWRDYREETLRHLAGESPPDGRDEHWRYTRAQDFCPPLPSAETTPARTQETEFDALFPAEETLVLGPGALDDPQARRTWEQCHGLIVRTLDEAWEQEPDLLRPVLERSPVRDQYFVRWNTAHLKEGYCLRVRGNRAVGRTLKILWKETEPAAIRRTILVLEPGAQLDLVEGEAGLPGGWRNVVREIHVRPHARLRHLLLDSLEKEETWLWTTGVCVDEDSSYELLAVHAGNKRARHDLHISLQGLQSRAALNAVALLPTRRHLDLQTEIRHRSDRTESRQLVHIAAAEQAHGVYGGNVVVEPATHDTLAHQQSRGLLLSGRAEIDTRPELRIHSDDVRCSHGASVGELDPEILFYLRSRGIDLDRARALLLEAFAAQVFNESNVEQDSGLRAPVTARLSALVRLLVKDSPP